MRNNYINNLIFSNMIKKGRERGMNQEDLFISLFIISYIKLNLRRYDLLGIRALCAQACFADRHSAVRCSLNPDQVISVTRGPQCLVSRQTW